jgi:hypothetical protein
LMLTIRPRADVDFQSFGLKTIQLSYLQPG